MVTIESVTLINLINNLIEEAVCDGADCGGAYHQNITNLITATNNLLDCLGLSQYYETIETNDYTNWSIVKIVNKKGMEENGT